MVQAEIPRRMRLIEADCKVCGKTVSFEVEEKPRDHYPFSFIYYHGKPVHALISYIDMNYAIRSCQVIQEFSGQVTAPSEKITKKCVVVGDWGVGKTSFIQRIVKDCFDEDYDPTVTQCRSSCIFVLPNKRSLDIEFWDAAGQHEYFHNDPDWWSFVSGADAVIIMGDVTKPDSFKIMEGILQDVKKLARKNAIILGIANKTDRAKERKVKATDLDKFEDLYEIPIFELSVKEKNNLDEVINRLIVDLGKE